jgi:uncharacterized protein (TIGR02266 family)
MQVTTHPADIDPNADEAETALLHRDPTIVRVEYTNVEDFLVDYTSNNTIGGMFIKTDRPLPTRERFCLRLQLPGGRAAMETEAEVRWTLPADVAAPMIPGMGVRFEPLANGDRDYVESLIADWR